MISSQWADLQKLYVIITDTSSVSCLWSHKLCLPRKKFFFLKDLWKKGIIWFVFLDHPPPNWCLTTRFQTRYEKPCEVWISCVTKWCRWSDIPVIPPCIWLAFLQRWISSDNTFCGVEISTYEVCGHHEHGTLAGEPSWMEHSSAKMNFVDGNCEVAGEFCWFGLVVGLCFFQNISI